MNLRGKLAIGMLGSGAGDVKVIFLQKAMECGLYRGVDLRRIAALAHGVYRATIHLENTNNVRDYRKRRQAA